MVEIKQKIDELQNAESKVPVVPIPSIPIQSLIKVKGGTLLKKQNKTKIKQRIHKSISNFHKTNNFKTLKREIQIIKRRFSRGKK